MIRTTRRHDRAGSGPVQEGVEGRGASCRHGNPRYGLALSREAAHSFALIRPAGRTALGNQPGVNDDAASLEPSTII